MSTEIGGVVFTPLGAKISDLPPALAAQVCDERMAAQLEWAEEFGPEFAALVFGSGR